MVEVFKTNVMDRQQAEVLIEQIHQNFPAYNANFDLDDCDKILRIESKNLFIDSVLLIGLLKKHGYEAEILADIPFILEQ